MDPDHPERDSAWDTAARNESALGRLDRNWADLLQELRVVQTGVQLLTGFLLTLPFQQRFHELSRYQQSVYLVTVALSATSTAVLIAPVALHRALFRQHARRLLVSAAHRLTIAGLALLALSVIGVVMLTFDVVRGHTASVSAAAVTVALFAALWVLLPWAARSRTAPEEPTVR